MNTVYIHHKDAHSMAKAIGDLPYEIIDHGNDIQYMIFISHFVKMSVIRIPSELMEWKSIDYSNKSNYEIALIVDSELRHETVQGHLTVDDIERLITEYRYGPLLVPEELEKYV